MAVTRQTNVVRVAATGDTVVDAQNVVGILYIPGTGSPAVSIKRTDDSGMVLWECSGASRIFDNVELRLKGTTYFNLAGTGTVLYLYTDNKG